MRVSLIGCGSGDIRMLSAEAAGRISAASLVIGGERLLFGAASLINGRTRNLFLADEIVREIRKEMETCGEGGAAVLLSGDTGFFSGAALLSEKLEEAKIPYEILPGISSMAMLAARLHTSYPDWKIISLHGRVRGMEELKRQVLSGLMSGRKTFYLTDGTWNAGRICQVIAGAGLGDLKVTAGENLFTEGERIRSGSAKEMASETFSPMTVLLTDAAPFFERRTGGFPDSFFVRGPFPMTRQIVRSAVLSVLGITDGSVVWDIGAGTGSVSVEMALADRDGQVFAIEKEEEGIRLIRENRNKFCCWNLQPVQGTAPEALEGLPAPDFVFIGGSGGRLEEILEVISSSGRPLRLALTAVTLETVSKALSCLKKAGMAFEVLQLGVSRTEERGRFHMIKAENPIFIIHSAGENES